MTFNTDILAFLRKKKRKKARKIIKKIERGDTSIEHRYDYAEKLASYAKNGQRAAFIGAFHAAWNDYVI